MIEVFTQDELDAALKDSPNDIIVCRGSGSFSVSGQASVRASGQASVSVWEQASVSVWGQASVSASGQASVRAWEQASVRAWGQASVSASKYVTVHAAAGVTVEGGILIPPIATPAAWCDFYGATVGADGLVVLYKAVDADYQSGHGFLYLPGTMPEAPDWDGGEKECGGGLHFCASPVQALEFFSEARRFLACPVRLDEIVVHPNADYPSKVKAPRVAAPVWEVDVHGRRV